MANTKKENKKIPYLNDGIQFKECYKCEQHKEHSEKFWRSRNSKTVNLRSVCRNCESNNTKKYNLLKSGKEITDNIINNKRKYKRTEINKENNTKTCSSQDCDSGILNINKNNFKVRKYPHSGKEYFSATCKTCDSRYEKSRPIKHPEKYKRKTDRFLAKQKEQSLKIKDIEKQEWQDENELLKVLNVMECNRCGKFRTLNLYRKRSAAKYKINTICLICEREQRKEWDIKNPDKLNIKLRKRAGQELFKRKQERLINPKPAIIIIQKIIKEKVTGQQRLEEYLNQIINGLDCNKYKIFNYIDKNSFESIISANFDSWMNWDNFGHHYTECWRDQDQSTWKWNLDISNVIIKYDTIIWDSVKIIPKSAKDLLNINILKYKTCVGCDEHKQLYGNYNIRNPSETYIKYKNYCINCDWIDDYYKQKLSNWFKCNKMDINNYNHMRGGYKYCKDIDCIRGLLEKNDQNFDSRIRNDNELFESLCRGCYVIYSNDYVQKNIERIRKKNKKNLILKQQEFHNSPGYIERKKNKDLKKIKQEWNIKYCEGCDKDHFDLKMFGIAHINDNKNITYHKYCNLYKNITNSKIFKFFLSEYPLLVNQKFIIQYQKFLEYKETLSILRQKKNKIKSMIKSQIRNHLLNKDIKKNGKTMDVLGYTSQQAADHFESLFEPWMNWKNNKIYIAKEWDNHNKATWGWHVDHLIPHSMFNYTSVKDDEFKACWALENLRPYSGKKNVEEGVYRARHNKEEYENYMKQWRLKNKK